MKELLRMMASQLSTDHGPNGITGNGCHGHRGYLNRPTLGIQPIAKFPLQHTHPDVTIYTDIKLYIEAYPPFLGRQNFMFLISVEGQSKHLNFGTLGHLQL